MVVHRWVKSDTTLVCQHHDEEQGTYCIITSRVDSSGNHVFSLTRFFNLSGRTVCSVDLQDLPDNVFIVRALYGGECLVEGL